MLIEDYALIGDCETAALVGKNGSIDWLCLPRFDSGACFAALVGARDNGRWQIAPMSGTATVTRRYRGDSLVLETLFETEEGSVLVVDFMTLRAGRSPDAWGIPEVVRIVCGQRGTVRMRAELILRFDYGALVPWVEKLEGGITAIVGPDRVTHRSPIELAGEDFTSVAEFEVSAGERVPFVLQYSPSHLPIPSPSDPERALAETERSWSEWAGGCDAQSRRDPLVLRSLITLKALTYAPTGGIVAAPTTSLPERLGGGRNWDYRFAWLRDATLTLYALINAGFHDEARAWQRWLLRAIAGRASQMQVLYGVTGERRLTELTVPWLAGYEGALPVRIGNQATDQLQLDVYGEVLDALYLCRRVGLGDSSSWRMEQEILAYLESKWIEPDCGIWEIRGEPRHFTHSKVMAWVGADRAVRSIEDFGVQGDAARWRRMRDRIHDDVCAHGYDPRRGTFVQHYGGDTLDASLLLLAPSGFLPVTDPRVARTIAAIERDLVSDGFVARYRSENGVDGLPPGEGMFLACTFWLVDNLVLLGRHDEARALFARVTKVANDLGLLAEEYDPIARRQTGNFPQAFSHVALVNTARNLSTAIGPAHHRGHHQC